MVMTENEIVRFYRSRRVPKEAIEILTDMNCTHRFEIKKILLEAGQAVPLSKAEREKFETIGIRVDDKGRIVKSEEDEILKEIATLQRVIEDTFEMIDACNKKMEGIANQCKDLVKEYFKLKDFVGELEDDIEETNERIEICYKRQAMRQG